MAVFSLLTDDQKAELWSCLALKYSRGLGYHSANALIVHYGNAFEAVELGRRAPGCWVSEGLVSERTAKAFAKESWREKARQEWDALQHSGREFVYRTHPHYPQLLAEIHDAPLILYYSGDVRLLANPMIGVVGSRKCSEEGILACANLTRQLSSFGITIVSGLAKGIDRAAHIAGLSSLGSSVAVLGTGIDVIYPESNEDVYEVLREKGLILSEFPPGTQPHAKNFPIRNRIISGLSRGVIIVEAAKRSGSLITARLALEQGRDVFAIPGSNVGSHSEGCHELIRSGAKPVFSAEDVVMDLAPLLSIDVTKQLACLKQDEPIQTLAQCAQILGDASALGDAPALPPLLEPVKKIQEKVYAYGAPRQITGQPTSQEQDHKRGQTQNQSDTLLRVQKQGQPQDRQSSQIPPSQTRHENLGAAVRLAEPSPSGKHDADDSAPEPLPCSLADASTQFQALTQETAQGAESAVPFGGSDIEETLLSLLHEDWQHIDWLSERLGVDSAKVSTALTLLEVTGRVVQKPGMFYRSA